MDRMRIVDGLEELLRYTKWMDEMRVSAVARISRLFLRRWRRLNG